MDRVELPEVLNQISHRVIGCAIEVHRELGIGLLESVSVQNGERYIAWSTDTPKVEEIAGLVSSLLP